jgi:hypothetical protein
MRSLRFSFLVGLALLAACTDGTSPNDPRLLATYSGPAVASTTDTVHFDLTVKNTSAEPFDAAIGQPLVAVVVYDHNGRVVWNSETGTFLSVARVLQLEPGAEETLEWWWDLRDQNGTRLAPGLYYVKARLREAGGDYIAADPHLHELRITT